MNEWMELSRRRIEDDWKKFGEGDEPIGEVIEKMREKIWEKKRERKIWSVKPVKIFDVRCSSNKNCASVFFSFLLSFSVFFPVSFSIWKNLFLEHYFSLLFSPVFFLCFALLFFSIFVFNFCLALLCFPMLCFALPCFHHSYFLTDN